MLSLLGTMMFAVATIAPSPTTTSAPIVAPASTVSTPAVAQTVRRHRQSVDAAVVRTPERSSLDAVLEEQNRLRVLLPPLSGDGGG